MTDPIKPPPDGFFVADDAVPFQWIRNQPMTSPMADETEEDHPAWLRLKKMHERGDFEKIERMVEFWDSLETLGRAGDLIRRTIVLAGRVLMWFAAIFAAYLAATGDLAKFLGRSSGGQ